MPPCVHTLPLGSRRDEYPTNHPTAPTFPEGQLEVAKLQERKLGGEFFSMYVYQKQPEDRQNRKLAGGKGKTETTTKHYREQELPTLIHFSPFNHTASKYWQD